MAPFRLKMNSCFAVKVINWSRRCLRHKHFLSSTDHGAVKFNFDKYPSSQDEGTDEVEDEMPFPFINPIKSGDHKKSLSSLSQNPLTIQYASRNISSDRRIYLEQFDSVTSILNQTKPAREKFALLKWTEAQMSELGKEEFLKKKKNIVKRGTSFHHEMQVFLQNKEDPRTLTGPNPGYWQSIHHVLKDITNLVAIESCVAHPLLRYAGKVDLIAEYKGALCVIDWKTSGKRRLSLKECFSYPQQIAAYAGAVNFDDNYPFQVFEGLIVTVYQDGFPADVHHISQEMFSGYWDEWLARIQQYRRRFPEIDLETRPAVREAQHFSTMADYCSAKSVNSIGTPLANLGAVVKDEDVITEEQFRKKNTSSLLSWLRQLRIGGGWKESCREFLQSFRFRGKNE